MKICVLGTRGFPNVQGGVENYCENLYPLLVDKGNQIVAFSRKPYILRNSDAIYKGVKLVPLRCPKNKFFETFLHTFFGVFAAKKIRPDILHIHTIGPALFVPLARLLGMKVIMTHQGPDYQRKKWGRIAKIILRLGEYVGARYSNAVIAISEDIAEGIKRNHNRKVSVIPNGIPVHKILDCQKNITKYGLEKQKYILAVGRFVPEKGFLDLIEAFNRLLELKPEIKKTGWKLVIVGRADHEDKYSKDLKKQAQKNPKVILTGFLAGEELQEIFSHAEIFVLPSYYEGLPIVLLEALSFGLSCIVTDIIGNRNLDISRERFFHPGDVAGMAKKIAEFIDRPLSVEEKESQIQMIYKKYNWQNIADKTEQVYRLVLEKC